MRSNSFRKFGGLILTGIMVLCIGMVSTNVQAQRGRGVIIRPRVGIGPRSIYRPWGYRRFGFAYSQYVFSSSDKAYNQGYKDGLSAGRGDQKHNRSYDPERSHFYQDAGFGNFGDAYRQGFLSGYGNGFRA